MRWSQSFIRTIKNIPKDEVSKNAQLLIQGGYIDKLMAGVYTYLPLGLRVLKKIENIVREEMVSAGGQEVLMPALQPKDIWQTTGRWDSLDVLFRFVSHYTKNELVLGPTHEEVLVPLAKKIILSHKDLPQYVFQIQTKFRDEKRAKSGILRGREFLMKDLYSFHKDEKELDAYYEKMTATYKRIFKRLGIGNQTYLTFASGGTFSKYSHEFQTLTEAGEDIIYLCEKCQMAINKEIISEQKACPQCSNKNLVEKKAVEVGNIFKLKTKYSHQFQLAYINEKGTSEEVMMGCYGIGLSRAMGTAVEVFGDKKGIVWPESIAPFRFHLIAINSKDDKKAAKEADKIYEYLIRGGQEVFYDDRDNKSAGEKFSDADLMGIPVRLVVSAKTLAKGKGIVEIKKRDKEKTKMIAVAELVRK